MKKKNFPGKLVCRSDVRERGERDRGGGKERERVIFIDGQGKRESVDLAEKYIIVMILWRKHKPLQSDD